MPSTNIEIHQRNRPYTCTRNEFRRTDGYARNYDVIAITFGETRIAIQTSPGGLPEFRAIETANLKQAAETTAEPNENDLKKMVRDPRYWRDQDPEIVVAVREGFRLLYKSEAAEQGR